MGSNNSNLKIGTEISLKIKEIIKKKHKAYHSLQKTILLILKEFNTTNKLDIHLKDLFYLIKNSNSTDYVIQFTELQNYLLANMQDRQTDKQQLKSKRKQFFTFARQNLCKIPQFILSHVLKQFNLSAQMRYENCKFEDLGQIKKIFSMLLRITQQIIKWFYGEEILDILSAANHDDQEANQNIHEIYLSELTEFIIFFDTDGSSYINKLRMKQIDMINSKIKENIHFTIKNLKTADNPKKEYLFPKQDDNCYQILLELIQKIAKSSLLTSKYKFICIIFDTIPALYFQYSLRKTKYDSYKTFHTTMLPQQNSKNIITSFNKNYEIENSISELLSTESKRQLAKYLLIQWYKNTQCDILKDILIPLKILSEENYLKQNNSSPLLVFLYAVYQVVGVDELQNSQLV